MTLDELKTFYNITDEQISRRTLVNNENGRKTALKELIGEAAIKKYKLWQELFPDYESKKRITSIKNQKDGIDFQITASDGTIYNIDLKSVTGDYSLVGDETTDHKSFIAADDCTLLRAPIELRQKGIFTNRSSKKTDFMLYIYHQPDGIYYAMLKYEDVVKISKESDYIVCKNKGLTQTTYVHHTSNNGTGEYILIPVNAKKVATFSDCTN